MFILKKFNSFKSYIEELTVFIKVNIPSLNASSILISEIVNKDETKNNEIIKTKTDKKYLYKY